MPHSPQTILLGPHTELHSGAHGSLRDDPPERTVYYLRGARHCFLMRDGAQLTDPTSPWRQPHRGEFLDFGPGPQVVHAVRWPVLNRSAWIADLDDCGYPLFLGRYAYSATHEDLTGDLWTPQRVSEARERARLMLRAYTHPSCRAVVMWSEYQRELTRTWIEQFELGALGERFLEKSVVVPPAQRPLLPSLVEQKWRRAYAPSIVAIGRDFNGKAGGLALRVMDRIVRHLPAVRCTYLGEVPAAERNLVPRVHCPGLVDRRTLLAHLRDSHILLHTSGAESFGMVFAEAAAHALAIVARFGVGTGHLPEILPDASVLIPDALDDEWLEEQFLASLQALAVDVDRCRTLALRAYSAATTGSLAIETRNTAFAALYRDAVEAAAPMLTIEDLEGAPALHRLLATSAEIRDLESGVLAERPIRQATFNVAMPEPWRIHAGHPPQPQTPRADVESARP